MEYWHRLVDAIAANGPFEYAPQKGRVGFMVRVRFAGVNTLRERGMTVHLWLKERVESPRFFKVEHLLRNDWLYWLRFTDPEQIDREVASWLSEH